MNISLSPEQRRTIILEHYSLEPSLIEASVPGCSITLHRKNNTLTLWCIEVYEDGEVIHSSDRNINYMEINKCFIVYGLLHPEATKIDVSPKNTNQRIYISNGLFILTTPVTEELIITFPDNYSSIIDSINIQVPPSQPVGFLTKLKRWIKWKTAAFRSSEQHTITYEKK